MSHDARGTKGQTAVPASGVEETSQIANAKAANGTWVVDIKMDRRVPSWSVAEQ